MNEEFDIWKDPRVVEALKERDASDIAILYCPACSIANYWNEGSHLTCRKCGQTWYVDEEMALNVEQLVDLAW